MLGPAHVVLATTCLLLGAVLLLRRKGGRPHRVLGYLYTVALVLVNLTALSVYEDSPRPGAFHVLAVVSLATLTAGFVPAVLRRPRRAWLPLHAYFLSWSYVGLVAAGVAQMATELTSLPGAVAVGVPTGLIVLTGGIWIHQGVGRGIAAVRGRQGYRHS